MTTGMTDAQAEPSRSAGKSATFRARRLEPKDMPGLWRIYEQSFGKGPLERLQQRWRWQFIDNPACKDQEASIWIAEIDGEIAAQLAAFPIRLKVMDREITVQFECDFAVDQQARTRNPVWALQFLREAVEKNGTPLKGGTDFTDPHRRMREWLKHKPLRISSHCSRPFRAGAIVQNLVDAGRLPPFVAKQPVRGVADAALNAAIWASNALRLPAADPSIQIRRVEAPSEAFDRLWIHLRAQYPITSVRDQTFIRWRFFEDPSFTNTMFGAYGESGDLLGYIVVRPGLMDDGYFTGRILDLFCDLDAPRVASSLLREGLRFLAKAGVVSASCRGMHPKLRRVVRQALYRPSPEEYDAHPPAMLLWTGPEELADAVYDENNWHFTWADGSGGFSP